MTTGGAGTRTPDPARQGGPPHQGEEPPNRPGRRDLRTEPPAAGQTQPPVWRTILGKHWKPKSFKLKERIKDISKKVKRVKCIK